MSPDRIHRARSADGTEIVAPVLLLHGTRTTLRWFTDAVHHVADDVCYAPAPWAAATTMSGTDTDRRAVAPLEPCAIGRGFNGCATPPR